MLQHLCDCLSGSAFKQIAEFDLVEDNYKRAWERLDKQYKKPEECRGLIIDQIFDYQFATQIDKVEESFTNYVLKVEKLLTSHDIDLLHEDAGVHHVLAHLTVKRLPPIVKDALLTLTKLTILPGRN